MESFSPFFPNFLLRSSRRRKCSRSIFTLASRQLSLTSNQPIGTDARTRAESDTFPVNANEAQPFSPRLTLVFARDFVFRVFTVSIPSLVRSPAVVLLPGLNEPNAGGRIHYRTFYVSRVLARAERVRSGEKESRPANEFVFSDRTDTVSLALDESSERASLTLSPIRSVRKGSLIAAFILSSIFDDFAT